MTLLRVSVLAADVPALCTLLRATSEPAGPSFAVGVPASFLGALARVLDALDAPGSPPVAFEGLFEFLGRAILNLVGLLKVLTVARDGRRARRRVPIHQLLSAQATRSTCPDKGSSFRARSQNAHPHRRHTAQLRNFKLDMNSLESMAIIQRGAKVPRVRKQQKALKSFKAGAPGIPTDPASTYCPQCALFGERYSSFSAFIGGLEPQGFSVSVPTSCFLFISELTLRSDACTAGMPMTAPRKC